MPSAKTPTWTFTPQWTGDDRTRPWHPQLHLVVAETGADLAVDVRISYDTDGAYVVGIAAVRLPIVGYTGGRTHVSPRDVQRLPLAKIVQAALAYANVLGEPSLGVPKPDEKPVEVVAAERVLLPRGRPKGGPGSMKFYKEIADAFKEFALTPGVSPAKEIARRKRVDPNTAHQWIHRARKLGLLEASPRARKSQPSEENANG